MINLIVGKKGTGKTKAIINSANNAKASENGDVVFICDGARHLFDIDHSIRLVDINEYDHENFRVFLSFINGILAQNYDITHIYIDSLLKIVDGDEDNLERFISDIAAVSDAKSVDFTVSISADKSELPEKIHKYIA